MKKLLSKKVAMIIIAVLVLSLATVMFVNFTKPAKKVDQYFTQTKVKTGSITITVAANGTVSSTTSVDVSSQNNGTLQTLNYKEGDRVKKGDILATIQDDTLTEDISRAENNLKQQSLSMTKLNDGLANLSIKSPADGRVKTIMARVGEDTGVTTKSYGALAVISTDGKMKMMVEPEKDVAVPVQTGDLVKVTLSNGTVVDGTIVDATGTGSQLPTSGSIQVEIARDDLTVGTSATVAKSDGTVIGQGSLEINKGIDVIGGNGVISKISVTENKIVKRGSTLFTLKNIDVKSSIDSQNISIQQAQSDLESKKAQLNGTSITSPFDGVIVTQTVKVGDSMQQGKVIATIMDLSQMQAVVTVDELDIAKVQIGQKANITLDALPGKEFTGKVTKINDIGAPSNGVTTYDVTVIIDKPDQIKVGMTSNATIEVSSKDHVLVLPIEAVQGTGDQRFVIIPGTPTGSPAPGAVNPNRINRPKQGNGALNGMGAQNMRRVTVGLMNENDVEIVSGLKEGEPVLIPITTSQTSTTQQGLLGGGIMGLGGQRKIQIQGGNGRNSNQPVQTPKKSKAPAASSKPNRNK